MTPAVDRLLDLLLEAGRAVERIELTAADARALLAGGSSLQTFRYDGALWHRGFRIEAGHRSRIVAQDRDGLIGFPLPERIAL